MVCPSSSSRPSQATAINAFRNTTIFWNRQGVFANGDVTALPEVAPFQQSHEELDARAIDFTGDGLLDLVVVGTQGNPARYDGWFVQLFVNQGNRRFVEETYARLAPSDAAGGIPGERTILAWNLADLGSPRLTSMATAPRTSPSNSAAAVTGTASHWKCRSSG